MILVRSFVHQLFAAKSPLVVVVILRCLSAFVVAGWAFSGDICLPCDMNQRFDHWSRHRLVGFMFGTLLLFCIISTPWILSPITVAYLTLCWERLMAHKSSSEHSADPQADDDAEGDERRKVQDTSSVLCSGVSRRLNGVIKHGKALLVGVDVAWAEAHQSRVVRFFVVGHKVIRLVIGAPALLLLPAAAILLCCRC